MSEQSIALRNNNLTDGDSVFELSSKQQAKSAPVLISRDEAHFQQLARSLEQQLCKHERRLEAIRITPGGSGQAALERDLEIHRLSEQLRQLRRYGIDMGLGRMIETGNTEPVYIGRRGLTGENGEPLMIDWRAPKAEPFFAATYANPMGLVSRRRYRWANGRICDYWDEKLATEDDVAQLALDEESAFIASLAHHRSAKMRDVLATLQSDQDTIIRAPAKGALVIEGGPGTGKTVVALHRAAYLLYSAPEHTSGQGGVLFIGPSSAYLAYVDDVLPSLGEDSVHLATLAELVPEGAKALPEFDPKVDELKASGQFVTALETAVNLYEQAPNTELLVSTPWVELTLSAAQWDEAFDISQESTDHNAVRESVWQALLEILTDQYAGDEVPRHILHSYLASDEELRTVFSRSWPILDPAKLLASFWSSPAFLRRCAPWLSEEQITLLQREYPEAWTISDLPLLDAARHLAGDPNRIRTEQKRSARLAVEAEQMSLVVDDLIAADDGEGLVTMLRGQDLRNTLTDDLEEARSDSEKLAGPFGHIIVDEAQELSDAQWLMLKRRCPSGSFTIVGDRAQARYGFTESWQQRFERIGLGQLTLATLNVNYRTPAEIMKEAEPVIREQIVDASVPTSIRENGIPVKYGRVDELEQLVIEWCESHSSGVACVIGDTSFAERGRVRSMTPELVKGLEFDLVVLVNPSGFGVGIEGAVDRYVAMTRATEQLVILEN